MCTVKHTFLLQIRLSLHGLSLANKNMVVFFDLPWIWTRVLLQFAEGVDGRVGSLTQARFFLILILAQFVDGLVISLTQAKS